MKLVKMWCFCSYRLPRQRWPTALAGIPPRFRCSPLRLHCPPLPLKPPVQTRLADANTGISHDQVRWWSIRCPHCPSSKTRDLSPTDSAQVASTEAVCEWLPVNNSMFGQQKGLHPMRLMWRRATRETRQRTMPSIKWTLNQAVQYSQSFRPRRPHSPDARQCLEDATTSDFVSFAKFSRFPI